MTTSQNNNNNNNCNGIYVIVCLHSGELEVGSAVGIVRDRDMGGGGGVRERDVASINAAR